MARRYDHLRTKAIELRTRHNMTLEDIMERLALPKTTVYYSKTCPSRAPRNKVRRSKHALMT